jgi:hypothetical protein
MELYLTVIFWVLSFKLLIYVLRMAVSVYPRKEETTLSFDVAVLFLSLPFYVWVIYLKWWVV